MSADGGHMSRLIFPLIVTTLSLVLTNTASTKFELFSILTMKNIFFFQAKNEENSVKDDTVAWLESDQ